MGDHAGRRHACITRGDKQLEKNMNFPAHFLSVAFFFFFQATTQRCNQSDHGDEELVKRSHSSGQEKNKDNQILNRKKEGEGKTERAKGKFISRWTLQSTKWSQTSC